MFHSTEISTNPHEYHHINHIIKRSNLPLKLSRKKFFDPRTIHTNKHYGTWSAVWTTKKIPTANFHNPRSCNYTINTISHITRHGPKKFMKLRRKIDTLNNSAGKKYRCKALKYVQVHHARSIFRVYLQEDVANLIQKFFAMVDNYDVPERDREHFFGYTFKDDSLQLYNLLI